MTSPNHSGCSIWTETVIELRERQNEEILTKTDLCRANHGGGAADHNEQPG